MFPPTCAPLLVWRAGTLLKTKSMDIKTGGKRLRLPLFFAWMLLTACLVWNVYAQDVEQVSLGVGATEQVFYSFENGEVGRMSLSDWDLAFDVGLGAWQTAVRFNHVRLISHPGGALQEVSLYRVDGRDNLKDEATWTPLHDESTSWDYSAFTPKDLPMVDDYGWGIYDSGTHNINGKEDRYYVLRYKDADGETQEEKCLQLAGLVFEADRTQQYIFSYATLHPDGMLGSPTQVAISRADYATKNFVYLSLDGNGAHAGEVRDLEPPKNAWDIVFTRYETAATMEGVTMHVPSIGVLLNNGMEATKQVLVQGTPAIPADADFSGDRDVIGYDWKVFDHNTLAYTLVSDRVYFVRRPSTTQRPTSDIWWLAFTDFVDVPGPTTISFKKMLYEDPNAGMLRKDIVRPRSFFSPPVGVYPNPFIRGDDQWLSVGGYQETTLPCFFRILDQTGRQVQGPTACHAAFLVPDGLPVGTYLITFGEGGLGRQRFIIK